MITVCLLLTVIILSVFCAVVTAWDWLEPRVLPRWQRLVRRYKRGLCAKWLAEEGLTVKPLNEQKALAPVGVEELIDLINEI